MLEQGGVLAEGFGDQIVCLAILGLQHLDVAAVHGLRIREVAVLAEHKGEVGQGLVGERIFVA